jgi:hypothetical protein
VLKSSSENSLKNKSEGLKKNSDDNSGSKRFISKILEYSKRFLLKCLEYGKSLFYINYHLNKKLMF